jgi:putative hydrolase of the HAD superfamily
MKAVEAIFFDFDNTLVDDDASQRVALARVSRDVCMSLPDLQHDLLANTYLSVSEVFWQTTTYVTDIIETRHSLWREAFATHGCSDEALVLAANEAYSKERTVVCELYEDTREVIERLRRRYRLAIITNGGTDQQSGRLRAAGMEGYFELLVASNGSIGKPEVAIFHDALQQMQLDPTSVWHVGDRLDADVLGANNAGLTSVWLNRRGATRRAQDPAPHHEIETLSMLATLLGE